MKNTWITCGLALLLAALGAGCTGQNAIERHFERGNRFFERERYAEAIVSYMSVLQRTPDHEEAIRQLGLAYYHNGEHARAYPLLRHAAYLEPERADLKVRLARLYLAGGIPEEARHTAGTVLEREPGHLDALVVLANASHTPEDVEEGLALLDGVKEGLEHEPRYHLALGALHTRKGDTKAAEEALSQAIRLAPDEPEAYVARGELHAQRNDQESAAADFRKAYELAPRASMAGVRWAAFNRSIGRMDDARVILDTMIGVSPEFVPALYERAAIAVAEEHFEEAIDRLERILDIHPDHLSSRLLRVRIWYRLGRVAEAGDALEEMVRTYPNSPPVRLEMARVMLRRGQPGRAEVELREALRLAPNFGEAALALAELDLRAGRYASAVNRLAPFVVPESPVRTSALVLMGSAMRMSGDWKQALEVYRELAKAAPESAEPAFHLGMTYQAAGRIEDAVASFRQVLAMEPAFVPALARLADIEMAEGRLEEAMALVERQIEAAPEAAGLHYVRASVAIQQEAWPDVEAALLKAVEIDPSLAPAYRDLGRMYVHQGRIEDALDKFNAGLGVNPRDTASLMMLGVLYEQEGRIDEAMETYEKILRIDPNFAAALNNLAFQLARQERNLDRALDLAQRARQIAPGDPIIADTLGLVALMRGDYRWALSLLEESVRQLSGEPVVWHHLALARHGLGHEDEAREALSRALAIERDFPGRDEARLLQGVLEIPLRGFGPEEAARLDEAREAMPDNPSVLVRIAALREQEGHRAEARELNNRALAIAEDFLPALINLTWLEQERPERAIAHGRRARQLASDHPEVAHALGWAAYVAADYAWSRSLLAEAATRRPSDSDILFHLAQASLMMSRIDDSREEAARALATAERNRDTDPAPIGEFVALLDRYMKPAGQEEADVTGLVRALDSETPLVQLVRAWMATGEEAHRLYRELISRHPSWLLPVRDLAARRVDEGLYDEETFDLARRARNRLTDDPLARRTHAIVLASRGDAARAIPELQRVVRSDASDSLALYWLAESLSATGATEEAVDMMARAVEAGLPDTLKQAAVQFVESAAKE